MLSGTTGGLPKRSLYMSALASSPRGFWSVWAPWPQRDQTMFPDVLLRSLVFCPRGRCSRHPGHCPGSLHSWRQSLWTRLAARGLPGRLQGSGQCLRGGMLAGLALLCLRQAKPGAPGTRGPNPTSFSVRTASNESAGQGGAEGYSCLLSNESVKPHRLLLTAGLRPSIIRCCA